MSTDPIPIPLPTEIPERKKGGKISGRSTPRLIKIIERDREAVRLRVSGLTFVEIARRLGFRNEGGAWKAVDRELFRRPQPATEQERQVQIARYTALLNAYWEKALNNDHDACSEVFRAAERLDRLQGWDKGQVIRANFVNVEPGGVANVGDFRLPDDPAKQIRLVEAARTIEELTAPGGP